MKKIIFILATPFIIGLSYKASAQKSFSTSAWKNAEKIEVHNGTAKDLHTKAVKDFLKSFQYANEKWHVVKDGFIASFVKDSVQTKVYYTNKGHRNYVLSEYQENHLPVAVKDIAKRVYYNFTILVAYEIESASDKIYIIKMTDKTHLKTVRIINNEMEVIEDYLIG